MTCKRIATSLATTTALCLSLAVIASSADAAEVVLSGSIKSAAGEKMEGVTVSAKAEGSTITTTVFTDENGAYYFPPLEAGKYKVWAQALSFETAKSDVDLAAKKSQDFVLTSITDFETRVRQLPGDLILAGLPEETQRRQAHEAHLPQQLHELPYAELYAAASLRRERLARDRAGDEVDQRVRHVSAEHPAQSGARFPSEGACRLSRARAWTEPGRLQDHQSAAPHR